MLTDTSCVDDPVLGRKLTGSAADSPPSYCPVLHSVLQRTDVLCCQDRQSVQSLQIAPPVGYDSTSGIRSGRELVCEKVQTMHQTQITVLGSMCHVHRQRPSQENRTPIVTTGKIAPPARVAQQAVIADGRSGGSVW